MPNSYTLVNPYIEGDFKNKIQATNSAEASKLFYKKLSEHFNNAVPKFYFTIQKGGSGKGKYYHFKVTEKLEKNNVKFTLEPYDIIGGTNMESFNAKLNNAKSKVNQEGGKRRSKKSKKSRKSKKDEDSESDNWDTKSDISYVPVTNYNQPIYYWWYDPSLYNLQSYYIPTFYSTVTPVLQISLSN